MERPQSNKRDISRPSRPARTNRAREFPRRTGASSRARTGRPRPCVWPLAAVAVMVLTSCQSLPPLKPLNLSEPGWRVLQGQAVWTRATQAAGIAGEIWLALNVDGRAMTQFTKTPLPFLTARLDAARWQIEFHADNRRYAGRGRPPPQFIWLHLADGLSGKALPAPLQFRNEPNGAWRVVNTETGETLSGYLNP